MIFQTPEEAREWIRDNVGKHIRLRHPDQGYATYLIVRKDLLENTMGYNSTWNSKLYPELSYIRMWHNSNYKFETLKITNVSDMNIEV